MSDGVAAAPPLLLDVDRTGGVARLVVRTDLDITREDELVELAREALRSTGPTALVVDLVGVPFMDSSGLRAVLRTARIASQARVPMTLAVTPGPVTMLLEVAGVSGWFGYE